MLRRWRGDNERLFNEAPYIHKLNLVSNGIWTLDFMIWSQMDASIIWILYSYGAVLDVKPVCSEARYVLNPCPAESGYTLPLQTVQIQISRLLIWICTVCHSVCEFISTIWIKESDWLTIRSGRSILNYSAWQGLSPRWLSHSFADWNASQRIEVGYRLVR